MKMAPHEAALLARLSGGRPGWALAMAQHPDALTTRAAAIEDLWMVLHSNRSGRFAYADTAAHSPDPHALLGVWQSWWRDVLLLSEGSRVPPLHADRLEQLQELTAQVESQARAGDKRRADHPPVGSQHQCPPRHRSDAAGDAVPVTSTQKPFFA
jgi:DNA polymerase-3 subunit delta'